MAATSICIHLFMAYDRGQQTLSIKGQVVNVLAFVGQMASILTLQYEKSHRQFIIKWMSLCTNKTLFTKVMISPIGLESTSWLVPWSKTKDQNGKLQLEDNCFILISICVIWSFQKF